MMICIKCFILVEVVFLLIDEHHDFLVMWASPSGLSRTHSRSQLSDRSSKAERTTLVLGNMSHWTFLLSVSMIITISFLSKNGPLDFFFLDGTEKTN